MTTTRRRALFVALALAATLAACGDDDSGGDTDDGVASIDGDAAEQAADDGEGDGDGGGGPGGRGRDPEFEDAMLEYAQCMRDNGVDMPDPEFGDDGSVSIRAGGGPGEEPGGAEDPDFEAAEEECSPIMEDARPEVDIDPEEQAEMQDRMLQVAQCMREKGHDMPDPEFTDDGGVLMRSGPPEGGGGGEGPSAEFEADMEDCQDEAGVEGPGGGGLGTSRSDG
jgi:hypothetical protein